MGGVGGGWADALTVQNCKKVDHATGDLAFFRSQCFQQPFLKSQLAKCL